MREREADDDDGHLFVVVPPPPAEHLVEKYDFLLQLQQRRRRRGVSSSTAIPAERRRGEEDESSSSSHTTAEDVDVVHPSPDNHDRDGSGVTEGGSESGGGRLFLLPPPPKELVRKYLELCRKSGKSFSSPSSSGRSTSDDREKSDSGERRVLKGDEEGAKKPIQNRSADSKELGDRWERGKDVRRDEIMKIIISEEGNPIRNRSGSEELVDRWERGKDVRREEIMKLISSSSRHPAKKTDDDDSSRKTVVTSDGHGRRDGNDDARRRSGSKEKLIHYQWKNHHPHPQQQQRHFHQHPFSSPTTTACHHPATPVFAAAATNEVLTIRHPPLIPLVRERQDGPVGHPSPAPVEAAAVKKNISLATQPPPSPRMEAGVGLSGATASAAAAGPALEGRSIITTDLLDPPAAHAHAPAPPPPEEEDTTTTEARIAVTRRVLEAAMAATNASRESLREFSAARRRSLLRARNEALATNGDIAAGAGDAVGGDVSFPTSPNLPPPPQPHLEGGRRDLDLLPRIDLNDIDVAREEESPEASSPLRSLRLPRANSEALACEVDAEKDAEESAPTFVSRERLGLSSAEHMGSPSRARSATAATTGEVRVHAEATAAADAAAAEVKWIATSTPEMLPIPTLPQGGGRRDLLPSFFLELDDVGCKSYRRLADVVATHESPNAFPLQRSPWLLANAEVTMREAGAKFTESSKTKKTEKSVTKVPTAPPRKKRRRDHLPKKSKKSKDVAGEEELVTAAFVAASAAMASRRREAAAAKLAAGCR